MTRRVLRATIVEETKATGPNGSLTAEWHIHDQQGRRPPIHIGIAGPALLLHQSNINSNDVLEVSLGQAYDLLSAISRALDIPVKGF
jgi:hypothetical protein